MSYFLSGKNNPIKAAAQAIIYIAGAKYPMSILADNNSKNIANNNNFVEFILFSFSDNIQKQLAIYNYA